MRTSWVLAAALSLVAGATHAYLPGPIEVIRCPDTSILRLRDTTLSGNTFGAVLWTDGYWQAPMLPRLPTLSRCGPDGPLYRVERAEVIGRIEIGQPSPGVPEDWRTTPRVEAPQARDFQEALDAGWARDRNEALAWRLELWWLANSSMRRLGPCEVANNPVRLQPAMRANLLHLLALLDPSSEPERLLSGEVLRALELFRASGERLQAAFSPQRERQAQQIRTLALGGDPLVRRLERESLAHACPRRTARVRPRR